jgi:hypothetical protein
MQNEESILFHGFAGGGFSMAGAADISSFFILTSSFN